MISTNSRDPDADDVGVLFYAICKFGEANEEIDLWPHSFGELLGRAELAAEIIACYHTAEGDDWSGVLWCERLEAIDEDSLAAQLFMLNGRDDEIKRVTYQWLRNI